MDRINPSLFFDLKNNGNIEPGARRDDSEERGVSLPGFVCSPTTIHSTYYIVYEGRCALNYIKIDSFSHVTSLPFIVGPVGPHSPRPRTRTPAHFPPQPHRTATAAAPRHLCLATTGAGKNELRTVLQPLELRPSL